MAISANAPSNPNSPLRPRVFRSDQNAIAGLPTAMPNSAGANLAAISPTGAETDVTRNAGAACELSSTVNLSRIATLAPTSHW